MKLTRILLALGALSLAAGVAWVAQQTEPPGVAMTAAAQQFLGTLSAEQKAKATFPFDSKERTRWFFTPQQDRNRKATRKGLPLAAMSDGQKKAALALVAAGTSKHGNTQALTIMSLEAVLHDLEKGGAMVRNPDWYFFTVFGTPAKTGRWGWRVEGHHLSLNYVIEGGKVVSATPAFFGANPATVKNGPRKGTRTLPQAEDLARELFQSLDEGQQKVAYRKQNFGEAKEASVRPVEVAAPEGLAAAKMTEKQRGLLRRLVEAYARRLAPEVAAEQMKQVREGGLENIHFAYAGGTNAGVPHTYRVQGPSFVIEFLNTQSDGAGNPANHIHSVWRNMKGDFGTAAEGG
jgi:hypothetical protein